MKYLRNTKTLVAVIAVLVLVPCMARLSASDALRQRSHLQQARIYRDAGRFYAARAEYLAALRRSPLDIALHDEYLAAEIHHARLTGDIPTIEELHERYEFLHDRRVAQLNALLPPKDPAGNEAEAELRERYKFLRECPEAQLNTLLRPKDPDEAEGEKKKEPPPPDKELAVYKYGYGVMRAETGAVNERSNGPIEGFGWFKKARYNDPGNPCILARLATMQLESPGRTEAAWGEKHIKIAIAAAPERARNYEELFAYYVRTGRDGEALALLPQARANTGDTQLLAEEAAQAHLGNFNVFAAAGAYLRAKAGALSALMILALAAIAATAWVAALARQSAVRVAPIKILFAAAIGVFGVALALVGDHLLDGFFDKGRGAARGWLIFENALRTGLIAEGAKFLAIVALVWKLARVRSVAEGTIIGAAVGGVFAALNALIVARGIGADAISGQLFAAAALEVCGGAIAGFFAARETVRPSERPLTALAGLLIATAFHAAFTVAGEIDASVAYGAFLIVAAEAALAQYLFGRARAADEWPGRVEARLVRGDVAIILGLGLAVLFAACFSILAVDFRSAGEIARTGLPELLRAGFIAAVFCLVARKTKSAPENIGPRIFTR